jgi:hypothetical protein
LATDVVWALLGLEPKKGQDALERFLEKDVLADSFQAVMETELDVLFVKNGYFSIKTSRGCNYFLSDDLSGVFETPPAGTSFPLLKALEGAVDRVVLPTKPLVLDLPQGLDDTAKKVIAIFNRVGPQTPEKICLWGKNNTLLWEYGINAGQKNYFIARLDEESGLIKDVELDLMKMPQQIYDPVSDQNYTILEGWYGASFLDTAAQKLRVLVVTLQEQNTRAILLTNMEEDVRSAQDVVNDYLSRFFYFKHNAVAEKKENVEKNKNNSSDEQENRNFIIQKILPVFEKHIKYRFINNENHEILQSIYALSGYFKRYKDFILIRLILPEGFSYLEQLEKMVHAFNSSVLEDGHKQRWCFSIEKPSF